MKQKACLSTGFLWPVFSRKRIEFTILPLFEKIIATRILGKIEILGGIKQKL